MFNTPLSQPLLDEPGDDLARTGLRRVEPEDGEQASTISSQELARLTGVGRERLRTWERRYGFPEPSRSRNAVRRYRVSDVKLVAAVSQLAGHGVPLQTAINEVLQRNAEPAAPTTLGAVLEHVPTPVIAVSGPDPLTVAWLNAATGKHPDSIRVGDDLLDAVPGFGTAARKQLRSVMNGEGPRARIVTHLSWLGTFPEAVSSLVWRREDELTGEPLAVLVQLPAAKSLPGQEHLAIVPPEQSRSASWALAVGKARRVMEAHDGLVGVQQSLGLLARSVSSIDGLLALCIGENVRVASSVAGRGSRIVHQAQCPDLVQALTDTEIDWLAPSSIKSLGLDSGLAAVAIPLVAAQEHLGVAVLAFRQEIALDDTARELLLGFGARTASALIRERAQQHRQRTGAASAPVAA
jgi:DNA-binding transcriptional MerR regulator